LYRDYWLFQLLASRFYLPLLESYGIVIAVGSNMNINIKRPRAQTRKATFNLHTDVLEALDQAMSEGKAPSKNVLVEQAIIMELTELRRQTRRAQWEEAVADPLFLKDIGDIEADFRYADAETARKIDE
jgi:hypothetical protein